MAYEPRGKVKTLCDAMAPRPEIALRASDCARIMGVMQSNLPAHLASAINHKVLHPISVGNQRYYGITPNARPEPEAGAPADVRAPRETTATGWQPPKMICTRPGAEAPHARGGSAVASASAAPAPVAHTTQPADWIGPDAAAPVPPVDQSSLHAAAALKSEIAKGGAINVEAMVESMTEHDEESEDTEPDAFISVNTGAITLIGHCTGRRWPRRDSARAGREDQALDRVGAVGMIELTLPYPISSNRYWRPVNIGKHITIVPTKEAKEYKAAVGWKARAAGVRAPIEGRIRVDIALYPQRPQDWAKRAQRDPVSWDDGVRCIDLDNANKVLLDALKGVAFVDDAWVRELHSQRMEPDGDARVVVTITPMALAAAPQLEIAA